MELCGSFGVFATVRWFVSGEAMYSATESRKRAEHCVQQANEFGISKSRQKTPNTIRGSMDRTSGVR
jgi:hypothetical protein